VGVLIRGESGVGKELVCRAIHQRSTRRSRPFVKVNCAALPADLLESELFGHERGAFTGAATTRIGKFEQADSGTLLLDEIGEMKPALQAKLLHVLQDGEFTKLGSNKRIQVDVRVVAATNRDLEKMMLSGDFREDLYYRLKVIELIVPPLRERRDETPTLIDFFIARYARKYNRPARPLSEPLRRLFMQYEWPGNIRELENMIKRVVILQDEQLVVREIERNMQRAVAAGAQAAATAAMAVGMGVGVPSGFGGPMPPLPYVSSPPPSEPNPTDADDLGTPVTPVNDEPIGAIGEPAGGSLATVAKAAAMKAERAAIEQTLRQVHWNRRKAAQILGVSYKTLLNKIKECGISRA
jgi:transcriptional regulator with GAF, ATPase, and Fis domain